jgi:hypothetical protein
MLASFIRATLVCAAIGVLGTLAAQPPLPPPEDEPVKKEQPQPGVKVAEKGPIHEAFAQPGAEVRGKEMTAPKAPPPAITEVPPDLKPEGANVKWIPGYWQWDENKNDFIWVSGFYRNVPPNRDWQPGKWIEKDGKNVYTPGFWSPTAPSNLKDDLPEPPKSIENGPSTPTDNPNAIWVPGGWDYRNGKFVWRGGYWAAPFQNMMWQPPQYVYNGSGFACVPGYWDYPLENRGILYAPVYIDPQISVNPNFTYTPQYAIGMGNPNGWGNGGLFGSMFTGPNYNNYYYGGYGNPYGLGSFGYGGLGDPLFGYGGFYPWWFAGNGFYNPLWNHYNWLNRGNRGWGEGVRGGRTGTGAGVNRGRVVAGTTVRGTAITPRAVGSSPAAAGLAAQGAARAAAAAKSAQVVHPASQVLANQSLRAIVNNAAISSAGGNGIGLGRTFAGGLQQAGGVTIRPGISTGPSHGLGIEQGVRGVGIEPSFHGSSSFRGSSVGSTHSSGGRSGGGRSGGGHR